MKTPSSAPIDASASHMKSLLCIAVFAMAAAAVMELSANYLLKVEAQPRYETSTSRGKLFVRSGQFYRQGASTPFTGWMLDHFPDGNVSLRTSVLNGRLNGISEGWYTNGVRQLEEHFQNGLADGIRSTWHANGHLRSEGHLVSGLQQGLYRQWDEKGNLVVEAEFAEGKPDGLSLAWFPSGYLKAEALMRKGEIATRHTYLDSVQTQPTLRSESNKSASLTKNP
ncbi:MAG: toxin-antitoxin system YwqK family antitoxin [Verrucomicrobiales bacterium]|nr:toxin-antitoxin system YwqK family antitoxin [Verrucomicrobiales bacterium]